ncbi:hypothetical protein ACGH2B_07865 [Streptomyces sp. BBFR2]|uniref:hypothetical protein n=1 Tax=Streptomyces sp. BBFR2 TaxID=3372854 RepID=UPI0037DA373D
MDRTTHGTAQQPTAGTGTDAGDGPGTNTGSRDGAAPGISCAHCGAVAEGSPPLWTCSMENGVRRFYCDGCARENLRAIEGRLDSAHW